MSCSSLVSSGSPLDKPKDLQTLLRNPRTRPDSAPAELPAQVTAGVHLNQDAGHG